MINPVDKDIGRRVIYRPSHDPYSNESGIITSFSDNLVFVRYGADTWSKGTYRRDLHWSEFDETEESS